MTTPLPYPSLKSHLLFCYIWWPSIWPIDLLFGFAYNHSIARLLFEQSLSKFAKSLGSSIVWVHLSFGFDYSQPQKSGAEWVKIYYCDEIEQRGPRQPSSGGQAPTGPGLATPLLRKSTLDLFQRSIASGSKKFLYLSVLQRMIGISFAHKYPTSTGLFEIFQHWGVKITCSK